MLTKQRICGILRKVDSSTFLFEIIVELSTFEVDFMTSRFEQFSASISCIYRCIQKIERVEMAKYGLKGPHAQCLLAVSHYPEGITAARLCTVCDKDKAAISRTVAELEREGLIRRQAKEGSSYRARLLLTERGMAAAAQVEQRAKLAVEKAGEGMTDAQRVIFYEVLDLIAGHLQMICEEGLE